jgi:sugar lactone lactonase YvrE
LNPGATIHEMMKTRVWGLRLQRQSLDTYSMLNRAGNFPAGSISLPKRCKKSAPKSLFIKTLGLKVRGLGVFTIASVFTISAAHAQGILSVTPTRSVATSVGTGVLGNSGNGGQATGATLADPSAVAFDSAGNIYIADAQNHVIREVTKAGVISIFAGTGVEGYGGDGAAATAAYLDTPTGVAVDTVGNVYIADSHNQRIRIVKSGTITTIVGNGTPGFSGDTGPATAAELSLPSAVAVDTAGNIYIADTNNQRIRKITGNTITTIAGNGEELFAGDGGAAISAVLDLPTGLAVDTTGNVYIADRHNQRIRRVTPSGTISTIAGSGLSSFSGAFAGDGASATAATLAKPSGVSVDAAGNIYIADTANQRIRQVSGGTIATVAGSGLQGFGGDSGPATDAILNSPKAAVPDAFGNLAIVDKLNQRLRVESVPALTFTSDNVGILSATQPVTLANTGSAPITVASIAFTGAFTIAAGGSCSAAPITLTPGASCTQNIAFLPIASGVSTGSVAFGGVGVVPQSILLSGTGIQTATTVTLSSNMAMPFVGQPITLTATVKATGVGTPTGKVSFYDGSTLLGAATLTSGSASLMTSLIAGLTAGSSSFTTGQAAGTQTLTAVYAGDNNFTGNASPMLAQIVTDFNLALAASTAGSQTVEPGQIASYAFSMQPIAGAFTFPITFSATGLPAGATITFTPQTITPGTSPSNFTMAIHTVATGASLAPHGLFGKGTITLSLLLLPFAGWRRRRLRGVRPLTLCIALLLSLAAIGGLAGCGNGSGFFGQSPQTYTVNVIGTANGAGGASLQHSTSVTLTVQ